MLYAKLARARYVFSMKSGNACPTCKGPRKPQSENGSFPFCSARCKLADLGNWLDGSYSLGAEPISEEDVDELRRKPN